MDTIDLANAAWRLRLYFQGRSQITIDSCLGEGTRGRILILLLEEERQEGSIELEGEKARDKEGEIRPCPGC